MSYPFKLLDAYTEKDKDIFFGRQEEIDLLYEMIFQTNVLLVYGASGTGKTSLIQCGLAGKFQIYDWLAIGIRRGSNINESFEKALAKAASSNRMAPVKTNDNITAENQKPLEQLFRDIYRNNFRPIYLIFDQLEEIYILGDKEEQDRFIATVKQVLAVEQPVKIIFSIREEYLAFLYEFEKSVPQLLRKKMRIEQMNLEKVKQVIRGVTDGDKTNIRLAEAEVDPFVDNLITKVKGNEKTLSIQLPYLQVYLDKLYLHITKDESKRAVANFTVDALSSFGSIDDVLKDFLDDQVEMVTKILAEKKIQVSSENIWSTLSPFITLEGTKAPTALVAVQNRLQGELTPDVVKEVVNALVGRHVLRYLDTDDLYEIAHDSLASEIAKHRSPEQVRILGAENFIKNKFSADPSRVDYLVPWQIELLEPVRDKLKISDAQKEFVAASILHEQENERARTRRKLWGLAGILLLVSGLIIFSVFMTNERNKAQVAKQLALVAVQTADSAREDAILSKQQADIQRDSARIASEYAGSANQKAQDLAVSLLNSQKRTEASAKLAREQRDKANALALIAESNRAVADSNRIVAEKNKLEANNLRDTADRTKNITQSLQYALQSILSEKPTEKMRLAIQSYDQNAQYNKNKWVPQITEALVKAIAANAVEKKATVKTGGILDIIPAADSIMLLITDAGEIRSFNLAATKDSTILLWKDKTFHYVNNSGYYDKAAKQLHAMDMNHNAFVFTLKNNIAELTEKKPLRAADALLTKDNLVLSPQDLRKQGADKNNLLFNFKEILVLCLQSAREKIM